MAHNHVDLGPKSVAICGGGLVGCLLAVYLRKHGFDVSIFESREDPRGREVSEGLRMSKKNAYGISQS
jgi:2-polyprenyl-6-methoxyphenol hydroxylase-like FAD-dependent oxidoreductase